MRASVRLMALLAWGALACGDARERNDAEKLDALGGMIEETRREFPDVPALGISEVTRLYEEGEVVFVDARTPDERHVSTLPGAITLDELRAAPEMFADRTIVVYCTVGYRSAQATGALRAEGHEVYNFEGSVLAWTHAGLTLQGPEGPTRRVHVFGQRWNLVADGYEAVW